MLSVDMVLLSAVRRGSPTQAVEKIRKNDGVLRKEYAVKPPWMAKQGHVFALSEMRSARCQAWQQRGVAAGRISSDWLRASPQMLAQIGAIPVTDPMARTTGRVLLGKQVCTSIVC